MQIPLDCPYCRTAKVSFSGSNWAACKPGGNNRLFLLFLQCPICGNGVIVKFREQTQNGFNSWLGGQVPSSNAVILEEVVPKPISLKAPKHTPENVSRFYSQGLDNLSKNFDAAGMMFRKALDAALKYLHKEGTGTLKKRINELPERVGVTPAMKTWAHEIRDLGNDAAHEDDPFTEAEAKTLQVFTELFLTYAFTLPGMMEERKKADLATGPQ